MYFVELGSSCEEKNTSSKSVEILPFLSVTELITTFIFIPITQHPTAKTGPVGSPSMHHCSK